MYGCILKVCRVRSHLFSYKKWKPYFLIWALRNHSPIANFLLIHSKAKATSQSKVPKDLAWKAAETHHLIEV